MDERLREWREAALEAEGELARAKKRGARIDKTAGLLRRRLEQNHFGEMLRWDWRVRDRKSPNGG